jgi:tetratricopeptide (TPR) repeat protein
MKRHLIYICIALCSVTGLRAQAFADSTVVYTKAMGDSAYAVADYATAIYVYEQLLANEGEAASVYYNLANGYYKQGEIARAILNYERALLLDPSNEDVQFNLELARSKAVDKNVIVTELFFVRWIRSFTAILSADGWAKASILCFIVLILCLTIFIFAKNKKTKKIIFIFALLSVVSTIVANIIAADRKEKMVLRENAIVMEPSVTIRSTPSVNGTELFILHEGKKVKVKDDSMKDWKEIEIEDGNIGWIPASAIERI